jgi:hypothetical protein
VLLKSGRILIAELIRLISLKNRLYDPNFIFRPSPPVAVLFRDTSKMFSGFLIIILNNHDRSVIDKISGYINDIAISTADGKSDFPLFVFNFQPEIVILEIPYIVFVYLPMIIFHDAHHLLFFKVLEFRSNIQPHIFEKE